MHVTSTILECGGLSSMTRALSSSLVYHKPLSALIMPGRTGHLQLYSTTTDKVLYNVSIKMFILNIFLSSIKAVATVMLVIII